MIGMLLIAHNPVEGIYQTTDDYVHAMEVRGASRRVVPTTAIVVQTRESDWLVEIEVIAAA
jgi:hypothetical protein